MASKEMSCAACHRPHARDGQTLADCGECHQTALMAKGGLHAKRGHGRCLDCHMPHLWTPTADACLRCHAGAPSHAKGKACVDCHGFGGAPLPPLPASAW